jgi:hypothetical protein
MPKPTLNAVRPTTRQAFDHWSGIARSAAIASVASRGESSPRPMRRRRRLSSETWFSCGTVGSRENESVRAPSVTNAASARKVASTVCPYSAATARTVSSLLIVPS